LASTAIVMAIHAVLRPLSRLVYEASATKAKSVALYWQPS
jgi:hypothetical protein